MTEYPVFAGVDFSSPDAPIVLDRLPEGHVIQVIDPNSVGHGLTIAGTAHDCPIFAQVSN